MNAAARRLFWAPRAWVAGRWRDSVLLGIAADDGRWASIEPDTAAPPQARVLPGPVLPGLVNAHSHAFQRAFAGLAERREGAHDDFWSWRERMYRVALRITPEALKAVAAALYAELLQGGYTRVCEFHYLHHAPDGRPYEDPACMSRALAEAAAETGIGLTLLPVLYQRAGFDASDLRPEQRRFRADARNVLALRDAVRGWKLPGIGAGVAIHSLRAAAPEAMRELATLVADDPGPIHIHLAEQTGEVEDCLAATGLRPIEWASRHLPLDARWQLVHATHALPAEIEAVARCGAGVVLCPSTEANLGDGLPDLPAWLAAGVPLAIGSDSQVTRQWPAELRWLEYGQRLAHRRRNVAAAPERDAPATAARLFECVLRGGAQAAGWAGGAAAAATAAGLVAGACADFVVLDPEAAGIAGLPPDAALDGLVFATDTAPFGQTWVAGRCVVAEGRHVDGQRIGQAGADAMRALHVDASSPSGES